MCNSIGTDTNEEQIGRSDSFLSFDCRSNSQRIAQMYKSYFNVPDNNAYSKVDKTVNKFGRTKRATVSNILIKNIWSQKILKSVKLIRRKQLHCMPQTNQNLIFKFETNRVENSSSASNSQARSLSFDRSKNCKTKHKRQFTSLSNLSKHEFAQSVKSLINRKAHKHRSSIFFGNKEEIKWELFQSKAERSKLSQISYFSFIQHSVTPCLNWTGLTRLAQRHE